MGPISDGAGRGLHLLLDSPEIHHSMDRGDYHCTVESERMDFGSRVCRYGIVVRKGVYDPGTPWGLCGAGE